MIESQKPQPELDDVQQWLNELYDQRVKELAPITGGFWSAAYCFRVGDEPLVLRLSHAIEGFLIDQKAMKFAEYGVPVPEILALGDWQDQYFAISRRHFGGFLENLTVAQGEPGGMALAALLQAMRDVPLDKNEPVNWFVDDGPRQDSWRDWLQAGLVEEASSITSGWREKLDADQSLSDLFIACQNQMQSLLPLCPERRDLVHGDLLHQNILLKEDASQVTAAFSWKCSVRGDFLYDVAWCTFWSAWYPGIVACNLWPRICRAEDITDEMLQHAPERHHCYELHIAATHIGWYLWTDDEPNLTRLKHSLGQLLARGPLPVNR